VVFFVFLCALGGFVVNGAQKPGAVIDFVWTSVAYFLASGAISDAFPISVNTRFSSGKCCLITRRASAGVDPGEKFPYRHGLFVIRARRELVPRECLWRWRPGGPGRSSSLSFPLAACNSEAEPQRLGAGSRNSFKNFRGTRTDGAFPAFSWFSRERIRLSPPPCRRLRH